MKRALLGIAFLSFSTATPVVADIVDPPRKVISEAVLREFSDRQYLEIIAGSFAAGRRYTPAQVASGLKRHSTEWRVRFVDAGYTIATETGDI